MVYTKLRSFMNEVWKGRANDLFTRAVSDCEIIDIDTASKHQRKVFADYLLKNYITFSPQRNRYLYEHLLTLLEIGDMFSLQDYGATVRTVAKREESIILSSLMVYWHKVEQAFYKYEVIINLFWLKGVEAELQGKDKDYVMKVIRNALSQIKEDTKVAHQELIDDLDLTKHLQKKKPSFFKIKLFEQSEAARAGDKQDGDTNQLIREVTLLRENLEKPFDRIHTLLLQSIETDFELRSKGKSDLALIEGLKKNIITELAGLRNIYQETYKKMEEKYRR
jgi:hypothetical protein